jgi:glycosyl hydrolase family 43
MHRIAIVWVGSFIGSVILFGAQQRSAPKMDPAKFLTQPLIPGIYTADPSAHVFNGKIFVYPSHDIDAGIPADDLGSHFAMRDYHVFSMDAVGGPTTDHGVALDIKSVAWAGRQMWAPDAAEKNGKYYLYFPAKDKQDVFRIGAAVADKPSGPFTAQPEPIKGSFSIDPAVFKDTDGQYYMYFGGIWGGQLQRWKTGSYTADDTQPAKDQPALSAKIARLGSDMTSFAETPKDVVLLDESGTTDDASSKRPGCTSTTVRTTFLIRPAIRTSSCTRLASHRMGRSPSKERCWSQSSVGPTTIRSSSSRGSGISSTTTRSSRAVRRTCGISR